MIFVVRDKIMVAYSYIVIKTKIDKDRLIMLITVNLVKVVLIVKFYIKISIRLNMV